MYLIQPYYYILHMILLCITYLLSDVSQAPKLYIISKKNMCLRKGFIVIGKRK